MQIVILRLNVGDFGKIGSYNVQEVGLAMALINKGFNVNVLYLHRKTSRIIQDETYNFVYYLPRFSIGLHGIFRTGTLKEFKPEKVILFSDNQFWSKNVIRWCNKNHILCVNYFGGVLSNNPRWINQLYTRLILYRNFNAYKHTINIAKTNKVEEELKSLNIRSHGVISVGLDETILRKGVFSKTLLRNELNLCESEKIILFIGRIVAYKKPFLACDILREILSTDSTFRLIIIGRGGLSDDLATYINKNSLSSKITRINQVPYNEIYKYMIACDCLINLSSIEIFGMTILEAMYYNLPVVAHTAPGPSDIIDVEQNGYLCNSDDPIEWKNMILLALNNKETICNNARKKVEEKFLWDSIATSFIEVIKHSRYFGA